MPAPVAADSQTADGCPAGPRASSGARPSRSILLYTRSCGIPRRADARDQGVHLFDALFPLRVGGVDDVQQQVGLARFHQRRAERGHELVRQLAHETDGVGDDQIRRVREREPPHGRVERREELVGDVGVARR